MGKIVSVVITADGENDELIWRSVYDNCLGEVEVVRRAESGLGHIFPYEDNRSLL